MAGFRSDSTGQAIAFAGSPPSQALPTLSSITIAKPPGTQSGDIIVAVFTAESFVSGGGITIEIAPQVTPWTTIINTASFLNLRVFWRVANIAEPSSYTFNFQRISTHASHAAFVQGIVAAYEGFTGPVRKTMTSGQSAVSITHVRVPPATTVVDIASATITAPGVTTTGGLEIVMWEAHEQIENFDGTVAVGTPGPYPGSVPYVTTAATSPTQDEQTYYAGTPNAGEFIDPVTTPGGTTYRAGNDTLTLASRVLVPGSLPDDTATFTWQHAGDESGFGEVIQGLRFVLEATYTQPYWGVLIGPM